MEFRNIDWRAVVRRLEAAEKAFQEHLISPPGCTCDPKPQMLLVTHDEAELVGVDPRCLSHKPEALARSYKPKGGS